MTERYDGIGEALGRFWEKLLQMHWKRRMKK